MLHDILPFMPLIAAILSGFVGYFFIIRWKKRDRFLTMSEDSLRECYSPMYHELHLIMISPESIEQKKLIDNFFKKYMSSSTLIYKISNSFLIDWFYDTEKAYSQFVSEWTSDNWKLFWKKFLAFYRMVESYYHDTHFNVYKDIRFNEYLSKKNTFFSLLIEFFGFLYEFFVFISAMLTISMLFYIYGLFVHVPGCNQIGLKWLGIALVISVVLLSPIMILANGFLVYKSPLRMNDNSVPSRLIEKIFHMDTWEERLDKMYSDKIVPDMPTRMDKNKGNTK